MKKFIGQKVKLHFREEAKAPLVDGRFHIALTLVLEKIEGGFVVGDKHLVPINSISYIEAVD